MTKRLKLIFTTTTLLCALGAGQAQAHAVTTYGTGTCDATTLMQRLRASTSLTSWNPKSWHSMTQSQQVSAQNLRANIAYVNNDTGAVLLKVTGKTGGLNTFQQVSSAPIVMAYYNATVGVGSIWIDRMVRIGGRRLVEELPFSPQSGVLLAGGYLGSNPFWQFIQGRNGNPTVASPYSFVNIKSNAFYTAVGLIMKRFGVTTGWIGSVNTTTSTSTSSSGGLFSKKQTTTVTYTGNPVWTLVTPSGAVPDSYTTSYALPVCNPDTGTLFTAGDTASAKAAVATYVDARTVGVPKGMTYNGTPTGALNVLSGMSYVDQGANPVGLDTSSWQLYQFSVSKSGLTGFGIFAANLLTGGGYTAYIAATHGLKPAINEINTTINAGNLGLLTNLSNNGPSSLYNPMNGQKQSTPNINVVTKSYSAHLGGQTTGSGTADSKFSENPNQSGGSTGVIGALTSSVSTPDPTSAPAPLSTQAGVARSQTLQPGSNSQASVTNKYLSSQTISTPYGNLPMTPQ